MTSTRLVHGAFRFSGLIALQLAAFVSPAGARLIAVSTTIQAAVDASQSGDTVKVSAGTYRENVLVTKNGIGIEVENSVRVTVFLNRCIGNSAGVLVDVLPGLDETVTNDVTVRQNLILANNRPNPVTDPADILSLLPSGVGLLNVGGDGLTAAGNIVTGNDSAGILIAQLPPDVAALDPRIDPFPDHNE